MTLWIALPLAVLALAALGLWLHHLFEGEWLPADLWRERRLARLSLAGLDRRWAAAPDRSDIVVTLTTTPSRIGLLAPTLKSLLDQSRPPARIVSMASSRPSHTPGGRTPSVNVKAVPLA